MGLPKILIFTSIYDAKDYCLDEFVNKALKITYPNKHHIFIDNSANKDYFLKLKRKLQPLGFSVYHIERGSNSREAIARTQMFARNKAITGNYDYLFSLESDIMVPSNILEQLLKHGKDVITALYHIGDRKKGQRVPCITLPDYNKYLNAFGTRLLSPEEWSSYTRQGLKQVQAGGFGTCLIHKRIFRRFPFFYDPRFQGHSDIYFFNTLFMSRIPVFVDTDIVCEHKNSNWDEVEDR